MRLLFAHATAVFLAGTALIGVDLKLFEIFYVTCDEDPTVAEILADAFAAIVVWLQDGLLVSHPYLIARIRLIDD
jgi:hypothetical protein